MVEGGKTVAGPAHALTLVVEQALRAWVQLAADGGLHEGAKDTAPNEMDISRLRAGNARLKLRGEIPNMATASARNQRNRMF